ncbi:MAG: negative regulator of flagellin synthesis FlgM [Pseudohongiellaceae bacterium]|jgi:negative regulator of flagellin synthesis FlgM
MVRDISGLGSPNRSELRSDRNSGDSPKAEKSSSTASPTAASNVSDQIELSSQAQTLKKLEAQLADLPEVNEDRVAALKSAIESGEYQVNDKQIAENLLGTEALFGR